MLEPLVRPFMQYTVRRWVDELRRDGDSAPWVVTTRPFTAPWVRALADDRLIYYNLDDYSLYRPSRARHVTTLEDELISRARLTLCLSQYQVDRLSERHPDRSEQIRHFPLGVTEAFLNPTPDSVPDPRSVGYIGNLSDRVDWPLVASVVKQCRNLRFVFVGRVDENERGTWVDTREEVFSYDHVEHVGYVPQSEVVKYYWASAVNWIPYDIEHPFNRAACPTKIMDSLASGRPIVSTSTPEFTLYPDWIDLADTADALATALREAAVSHDPDRNTAQVEFAARHTWKHRAAELLSWLDALN